MDLTDTNYKEIAVYGEIIKSNLRQNEYTVSLLKEAYRVGLLKLGDINAVQVQIMLILKEMIFRYTKGESSSVSTYTAENILNSILYCIDAFTLSCGSPEEAVRHLLTFKLKTVYEKGIRLVSRWLEDTFESYKDVRKHKLDVGLESYDHTINEDIPIFLRNYGVIFDSHNTSASIDYQLAFDDMSIRGVLYMKNYLAHLGIENNFCEYFDSREIEKLLLDFGRTVGTDYRIELINIFELVFNNAVFAVLAGDADNSLRIAKVKFDLLNHKLKASSDPEIVDCIERAIEKLIYKNNICKKDTLNYLNRYKEVLIKRVISCAASDSLNSLIIVEREEKKNSPVLFESGRQMKSSEFNLFLKKLMRLSKPFDKANLIKEEIGSLHDFIDILSSDCLYGDEFEALFGILGDMELAILSKIVFYEELRSDSLDLKHIVSVKKEGEFEWHNRFAEFMDKAGEVRIKSVEGLLNEIDYEEISFY